MPYFLLDTNIVSFLVRRTRPTLDYRVSLVPPEMLAISAVTEAEARFGIALNPAAKINRATEKFLLGTIVLPWDSLCAGRYGEMAAAQRVLGKPLSALDSMIAAHALAYDLTLISNDHAFEQVAGLKLQDWTKGPQRA